MFLNETPQNRSILVHMHIKLASCLISKFFSATVFHSEQFIPSNYHFNTIGSNNLDCTAQSGPHVPPKSLHVMSDSYPLFDSLLHKSTSDWFLGEEAALLQIFFRAQQFAFVEVFYVAFPGTKYANSVDMFAFFLPLFNIVSVMLINFQNRGYCKKFFFQ